MFSKTHRIKYSIIREAAGLSYGKNHWDYIDPRENTKIYQVMGVAGVNLTDYAVYLDFNFSKEVERSATVKNHQEVYFIDRRLDDLRPSLFTEKWSPVYPEGFDEI